MLDTRDIRTGQIKESGVQVHTMRVKSGGDKGTCHSVSINKEKSRKGEEWERENIEGERNEGANEHQSAGCQSGSEREEKDDG